MKKFKNEMFRINILVILISVIGITYTIYYAKVNNGIVNDVMNNGFGNMLQTYQEVSSNITGGQIFIILLLSITLTSSIMYIIFSKCRKTNYKEVFKDKEQNITRGIETFLLTIVIALILVIGSNLFLLNDSSNINQISQIKTNQSDSDRPSA